MSNHAHVILNQVREYAVELVSRDSMYEWGSHQGYLHGTTLLRMIDDKPNGVWDSRTKDWWKKDDT